MPRHAVTCTRLYRDPDGELRRCDGPMTLCRFAGTWTCTWCGCVLPAVYRVR